MNESDDFTTVDLALFTIGIVLFFLSHSARQQFGTLQYRGSCVYFSLGDVKLCGEAAMHGHASTSCAGPSFLLAGIQFWELLFVCFWWFLVTATCKSPLNFWC